MPTCVKCQVLTSTSKRCPHCRICYCSQACRSADWSRHKSECASGERVSSASNSSNMASSNNSLEDQIFAKPDTKKQIHCEGHPCVNCGKCRDWQFSGDLETWRWIQNYKNWTQGDKDYWVSSFGDHKFTKRSGATCYYQFSSPHYFHYLHFYGRGELGGPFSHIPGIFFDPPPGCLCDNNHKN